MADENSLYQVNNPDDIIMTTPSKVGRVENVPLSSSILGEVTSRLNSPGISNNATSEWCTDSSYLMRSISLPLDKKNNHYLRDIQDVIETLGRKEVLHCDGRMKINAMAKWITLLENKSVDPKTQAYVKIMQKGLGTSDKDGNVSFSSSLQFTFTTLSVHYRTSGVTIQ